MGELRQRNGHKYLGIPMHKRPCNECGNAPRKVWPGGKIESYCIDCFRLHSKHANRRYRRRKAKN